MQHYRTIQKAIDYIENNLTEDVSLYNIAEHVNFSVPHLYRIFKCITGETVKSYVQKRRLSLAAVELKTNSKNISEIAYEFGFESHDVFTRAFLREYSISPSKFRNADIDARVSPPFTINNFNESERRNNMEFEVINKNQIIVIGLECIARQWDADGAIGKLWSMFLGNVEKVEDAVKPNVMYGICECESCHEEGTFTYMAGIEVIADCLVPAGMTRRIIKKHKYIQADVPETVRTKDAYIKTAEYAEENGYKIDNFAELEVYDEFFQDPSDHAFKLLIPII